MQKFLELIKLIKLIKLQFSLINLIAWSDPGGEWLHRREAAVPPYDAHHLPGLQQQQVLQHQRQDHRPPHRESSER